MGKFHFLYLEDSNINNNKIKQNGFHYASKCVDKSNFFTMRVFVVAAYITA